MQERANRVRGISLPAVLLATGAKPDRNDKARWHTSRGVISITGCKFMNWNLSTGGGGAIDLVIHLNGLDFKGAVAWLCRRFPGRPPAQPLYASNLVAATYYIQVEQYASQVIRNHQAGSETACA